MNADSFSTPSRQDAETQSEPRKTRLSRRLAALELRESGGFALTRLGGAALLGRLPILITDLCVS
jgi:hypothetical protein